MQTETQENSYKIKTTGFEGPFGLLLRLVEERKLFINDLSLAEVTEDYIKYINTLEKSNHVEISSFVVVAATLILIKSKSLLPNLNLTTEEEGDIHNLEERLRLYELFTKLGINVKNTFGKKIIFAPQERKNDLRAWGHTNIIFLPDEQITKNSMMTFAREVLGGMPKKVSLSKVEIKKVISLEEMIDKLMERIQNSLKMNFKDFSGQATNREEKIVVIVGFLAMLELVRQGILNAVQEENSEDIIMSRRPEGVGIPTESVGRKNSS